ncbi:8859_t:CDS:2 [Rhizophagus irregularis]|uniref:Uncharacterized protein n=1 Tax=Rhizophagus irregularis (strain DAOM 181602 / DAOM 197198 / MUCL 43194) TaxID=747089 RepID=U9SWK4_RHIID|nr:8859_t:CDS:2 [Rhizophagus irregularis]
MSLKIPSHLILTQKPKEQLNKKILPEHKWRTRYSDKAKGIYALQWCCGSNMSLNTKKSNLEEAKERKTRKICEFVEDCQSCLPPPLRINETVKLMAQNLLQINVHPSHILDENKYMIKENIYPLSPTKKQ